MIGVEILRNVYDDDEMVYIQVGPDSDGLNCVRIHTENQKSIDWWGKIDFTINPDFAIQLAKAIERAALEAKGDCFIEK